MMKAFKILFLALFALVSTQSVGQQQLFLNQTGGAPPPTPGLLDQYKGAAFAAAPDVLLYSTYSATDDIAGSLTNGQVGQWSVAVFRDFDDAIKSFTPAEVADGTANTWVQELGPSDGFVRRWYDQSVTALDVSNLNHAEQSDPTKMPKLFDSSTGLILENGKAVIKATNDTQIFNLPISSNAIRDFFSVIFFDLTFSNFVTSLSDGSSGYFLIGTDGSTSTKLQNNVGSPTNYINGSIYIGTIRDNVYQDFQLQRLLSVIGASPTIWSQVAIGYRTSGGIKMSNTQLMVIYPSDQSTNRPGIENKINQEYQIY